LIADKDNSKYSACFLTDSTYALATLLTVNEIAKLGIIKKFEIFLYPSFENRSFEEALKRISYAWGTRISTQKLNSMPYSGAIPGSTFNDTVLAKLIIPISQKNNLSIFIDSGFWLLDSKQARKYLNTVLEGFKKSKKPIGAITKNNQALALAIFQQQSYYGTKKSTPIKISRKGQFQPLKGLSRRED